MSRVALFVFQILLLVLLIALPFLVWIELVRAAWPYVIHHPISSRANWIVTSWTAFVAICTSVAAIATAISRLSTGAGDNRAWAQWVRAFVVARATPLSRVRTTVFALASIAAIIIVGVH